ncbi:RsmB/NOP family class I SAM-dependent RNA methyltransferase [Paenibacillus methanolicus]|uniref:NOL1/NOP2/sun family putative RNA methylase n=1 Tax=Paenibacillus methanolicus TaxID=582686 RepID=A0A5S5C5V9_9BACL|nr:RsmB/NOP family class I SAM-dependent RNA methyltransferase [Paenibacillus methanolicus]TYP73776.1 NOL1/NOP2/sun family putative RNA methylase [Paenibacillus methanolicus]
MGITLPQSFADKMKRLLGPEYEAFLASYERPRKYGLRVNGLKLAPEAFLAMSPLKDRLTPVPWAEGAFYYEEQDRPGKHPHYHAGLYYIQEPSAMVPAELLGVAPGDRVLDLCAAPGGKSTQLAAKLKGEGVLVTNDNARERTKALAKNVELAGIRNAVVLNEEPAAIARVFPEWFDKILVDAPCSGEGMFRKDESMIAEWEKHSVERCSAMQRDILKHAADMLAPGGTLVYSTCTFSPEENETQIAELLAASPELEVVPVPLAYGWAPGRPAWVEAEAAASLSEPRLASIAGTVRLWPHLTEGEGHYAAVLRKSGEPKDGSLDARSGQSSDAVEVGKLNGDDGGRVGNRRSDTGRPAANKREERKRDREQDRALKSAPKAKDFRSKAAKAALAHAGNPSDAWKQFGAAHLHRLAREGYRIVAYGTRVYLQPAVVPPLDGLTVVRPGWYVGEAGTYRFAPSHPLAMALSADETRMSLHYEAEDADLIRYLKGETLHIEERDLRLRGGAEGDESANPLPSGYVLVCVNDYPVGWGKYSGGGMLKNELPAGWRWM